MASARRVRVRISDSIGPSSKAWVSFPAQCSIQTLEQRIVSLFHLVPSSSNTDHQQEQAQEQAQICSLLCLRLDGWELLPDDSTDIINTNDIIDVTYRPRRESRDKIQLQSSTTTTNEPSKKKQRIASNTTTRWENMFDGRPQTEDAEEGDYEEEKEGDDSDDDDDEDEDNDDETDTLGHYTRSGRRIITRKSVEDKVSPPGIFRKRPRRQIPSRPKSFHESTFLEAQKPASSTITIEDAPKAAQRLFSPHLHKPTQRKADPTKHLTSNHSSSKSSSPSSSSKSSSKSSSSSSSASEKDQDSSNSDVSLGKNQQPKRLKLSSSSSSSESVLSNPHSHDGRNNGDASRNKSPSKLTPPTIIIKPNVPLHVQFHPSFVHPSFYYMSKRFGYDESEWPQLINVDPRSPVGEDAPNFVIPDPDNTPELPRWNPPPKRGSLPSKQKQQISESSVSENEDENNQVEQHLSKEDTSMLSRNDASVSTAATNLSSTSAGGLPSQGSHKTKSRNRRRRILKQALRAKNQAQQGQTKEHDQQSQEQNTSQSKQAQTKSDSSMEDEIVSANLSSVIINETYSDENENDEKGDEPRETSVSTSLIVKDVSASDSSSGIKSIKKDIERPENEELMRKSMMMLSNKNKRKGFRKRMLEEEEDNHQAQQLQQPKRTIFYNSDDERKEHEKEQSSKNGSQENVAKKDTEDEDSEEPVVTKKGRISMEKAIARFMKKNTSASSSSSESSESSESSSDAASSESETSNSKKRSKTSVTNHQKGQIQDQSDEDVVIIEETALSPEPPSTSPKVTHDVNKIAQVDTATGEEKNRAQDEVQVFGAGSGEEDEGDDISFNARKKNASTNDTSSVSIDTSISAVNNKKNLLPYPPPPSSTNVENLPSTMIVSYVDVEDKEFQPGFVTYHHYPPSLIKNFHNNESGDGDDYTNEECENGYSSEDSDPTNRNQVNQHGKAKWVSNPDEINIGLNVVGRESAESKSRGGPLRADSEEDGLDSDHRIRHGNDMHENQPEENETKTEFADFTDAREKVSREFSDDELQQDDVYIDETDENEDEDSDDDLFRRKNKGVTVKDLGDESNSLKNENLADDESEWPSVKNVESRWEFLNDITQHDSIKPGTRVAIRVLDLSPTGSPELVTHLGTVLVDPQEVIKAKKPYGIDAELNNMDNDDTINKRMIPTGVSPPNSKGQPKGISLISYDSDNDDMVEVEGSGDYTRASWSEMSMNAMSTPNRLQNKRSLDSAIKRVPLRSSSSSPWPSPTLPAPQAPLNIDTQRSLAKDWSIEMRLHRPEHGGVTPQWRNRKARRWGFGADIEYDEETFQSERTWTWTQLDSIKWL